MGPTTTTNTPLTSITNCDSSAQRLHRSSPSTSHPTCARPIPNSYWATPYLLACEYPWNPFESSTQKLEKILAAGVRTFIDLTEAGELSPYAPHLPAIARAHAIPPSDIEYHQFPIRDRSLPESREFMFAILDVLRDNERRGRMSAVHCRGGIGRTGMVIGCWLVESGHAKNGEEALQTIASLWKTVEKCTRYPHSPETGPQHEFVKHFEARGVCGRADAAGSLYAVPFFLWDVASVWVQHLVPLPLGLRTTTSLVRYAVNALQCTHASFGRDLDRPMEHTPLGIGN